MRQFVEKFFLTPSRWTHFTEIRRFISNDTIFGLSSGFGKCGVAVIRVSGPQTMAAIRLLTHIDAVRNVQDKVRGVIRPRFATIRQLSHPKSWELIDRGLVLWFPVPNSFTGEDCCEFHVHGSVAVIAAMSDALNSIDGIRPAQPGEFTRRAFWSNKLDLTQVEGLADLIHAETEIQRKQALLQANGTLSKLYIDWRQRILRAVAHIEAYIDFSEDDNIDTDTIERVQCDVKELMCDIQRFLCDGRRGEMRRHGAKTVILGEPNVGKSSFMNHICRKPISIVASVAGTTRDVIETSFNIGGYPVVIADTAGLRSHTNDPIESEGISRATEYARCADLIILIMDATAIELYHGTVDEYKREYLHRIGIDADETIIGKHMLTIANKIDLLNETVSKVSSADDLICISCTSELGIDDVLDRIELKLKQICGEPSADSPTLTNDRHRHLLANCVEHLAVFIEDFSDGECVDFAISAQHLREAIRCIGFITGSINTEQILDVIFRDFCIGK